VDSKKASKTNFTPPLCHHPIEMEICCHMIKTKTYFCHQFCFSTVKKNVLLFIFNPPEGFELSTRLKSSMTISVEKHWSNLTIKEPGRKP
jgi:hypothetical protein